MVEIVPRETRLAVQTISNSVVLIPTEAVVSLSYHEQVVIPNFKNDQEA
jgi:hypothetical protein